MRLREFLGFFCLIPIIHNKLFMKEKKVRILMYHNVRNEDLDKFEQQIVYLINKGYKFIDYNTLTQYLSGKIKLSTISILVTFDDGFRSNYKISRILDQYDIKGIFFIPPAYINSANREIEKKFIKHNLFLDDFIGEVTDDLCALSWNQLIQMKRHGHTIGSHTNTHIRLSDTEDLMVLHEELNTSKSILELKTENNISAFAYPFGDIRSITKETLYIATTYYSYIFSAVRGFNSNRTTPNAIFRDQINPYDSKKYLRFIVEGGLDFLYRNKRRLLQEYAKPE